MLGKLLLEPLPASHSGSVWVGGQEAGRSCRESKAHSAQPPSQRFLLRHRRSSWLCLWGTPKAVASHASHPDWDAEPCSPLGRAGLHTSVNMHVNSCKMSMLDSRRLFPKNPRHRTQEGATVAALGKRDSRSSILEQNFTI